MQIQKKKKMLNIGIGIAWEASNAFLFFIADC
jgi:hypothetical protein